MSIAPVDNQMPTEVIIVKTRREDSTCHQRSIDLAVIEASPMAVNPLDRTEGIVIIKIEGIIRTPHLLPQILSMKTLEKCQVQEKATQTLVHLISKATEKVRIKSTATETTTIIPATPTLTSNIIPRTTTPTTDT